VEKKDLSSYKLAFARILSKAVVKEKDLQEFLKNEALEMKDNDFDVIVAFCKDDLIKNKNKTFKEVLVEYEEYPGQVDELIYEVPTITVLIPDLFGEFHASSWDTESEDVFVSTSVGDQIPVIYDGEELFSLSNNQMPGEPTLFVKTNERIRLKTSPQLLASTKPKLNSASFEFVNPAFDGMSSRVKLESGDRSSNLTPLRTTEPQRNVEFDFEISQKLVDAFNEFPPAAGGWQRDHIYYNLKDVPNAKGTLNRAFYECISAIKITNSGLNLMMDSGDDPKLLAIGSTYRQVRSPKLWTDGHFELQIDVLINDLNGAGSIFQTVLSIPGDKLFDPKFTTTVWKPHPKSRISYTYHTLVEVKPKYYYTHIPIKEWDLEKMGASWKISVRENDDQEVETSTETLTSKFAANFGLDFSTGEKAKIGLKFGGTLEDTHTQTFTFQRTRTHDFLGGAIVSFWDPVIRQKNIVPADDYNYIMDLRSLDRRLSAINYANTSQRSILSVILEQDDIKATSVNRYELTSFFPVMNNNFQIIMLPVYKY